jgi:hypothetical protein
MQSHAMVTALSASLSDVVIQSSLKTRSMFSSISHCTVGEINQSSRILGGLIRKLSWHSGPFGMKLSFDGHHSLPATSAECRAVIGGLWPGSKLVFFAPPVSLKRFCKARARLPRLKQPSSSPVSVEFYPARRNFRRYGITANFKYAVTWLKIRFRVRLRPPSTTSSAKTRIFGLPQPGLHPTWHDSGRRPQKELHSKRPTAGAS